MTIYAETAARLKALFVQELGLEPDEITDDLAYGDTPEWDSVGHMHLIAAIEEDFGFAFGDTEIGTLTSFAVMTHAVAAKIAA